MSHYALSITYHFGRLFFFMQKWRNFLIDKKSHSIIPWLKNGNKKSLTVKVLFTIRQLQPEYEIQRDPGSFFG